MIIKNRDTLIRINMIIGAILVIGFIGVIVNVFTGNPISKSIASNKIQQYIYDVYSSNDKIDKIYYSAKDGYYVAQTKIDNEEVVFKYASNLIVDEKIGEYYQKLFDNDYILACHTLMEDSNLEFPASQYIHTYVVANGNYDSNLKKLNIRQKIYLLGIRNYDKKISENDSKNMASKIVNQFMNELGNQYKFNSIQMSYIDKFGAYEIIINNKELTIDELSKNIKKLNSSEIGEEEKAFIDSFNS